MHEISVALPVAAAHHRTLGRAIGSLRAQTARELDIMVVLNGSDAPTAALAHEQARLDSRVRVLTLPGPNLAAALNFALREARSPLVARMDADDTCPPHRLALQAAYMREHPAVAALGSAWELIDAGDAGGEGEGASGAERVISTVRPPCEPARIRWRLLLGNVLAHGSMMLRRDAVLAVGGYDPTCLRAQDYDLWLRLSKVADIAALPDVLYQHRTRHPAGPHRSTCEQAAVAAPRMFDAWRDLPPSHTPALLAAVSRILTDGEGGGAEIGRAEIEAVLSAEGPTREAMLAWLWAAWFTPPAPRRAVEVGRLSRLREVGRSMCAAGVERLWLWGAGDHTGWLLDHADALPMPVVGLIDDALAGESRFGHQITSPATLTPGDHALLSSDWHEDRLWHSSIPHQSRGVHIWRLYG